VGVSEGHVAGRRDRQGRLLGLVQGDRELGRVGRVVVGVTVLVGGDLAGAGAVDDVQLAGRDGAVGAVGDRDAERPGAGAAAGGDVVVGVSEGHVAGRRDRQGRLLGLVQGDRELGRVGRVVVGVTVLVGGDLAGA